jgi:hypothetical protein
MPSHEGKAVEGKTEPDDRESEARDEDETAEKARRPKGRGAQKGIPREVANNRRHAASTRRASPSRYRYSETVSMRPHSVAAP